MEGLLSTKNPMFVERINNPKNYGYIDNEDGSISTHRMAAEIDEEGNVYAFPLIVQMPDGSLHQFEDPFEAMDYNKSVGNVLPFDDIESALEYTKSYKTPEFKEYYRGLLDAR